MESAEQSGPSSNNRVTTDASSNNAPAEKEKTPTTENKPKLSKGVENAKKRLRAFSIQKKTHIAPVIVPKPTSSGHTTVLIGKLSGVKPSTPKVDDETKKLPKPPKPGSNKKALQDSYVDLQKRTLAEIEDMKRKMELVELGIPLGLICPTSTSEKAMPTKAMPPIKHFLDPAKVDEIIQEAKQARDEGRKYKFDYQKLLPKYDNPFQRKKDEDKNKSLESRGKGFDRDKKRSDKYDPRRHSEYRRDDRDRYKYKDKSKERKDRNCDSEEAKKDIDKETKVNLNDYLVCDSWSLDTEEKGGSSPTFDDKTTSKHTADTKYAKAIPEQVRASVMKNQDKLKEYTRDSPIRPMKFEKLKPVMDSFKFEIDPNDDEMLDIFDMNSGIEKYARKTRGPSIYSPTDLKVDYDQDTSKDISSLDDTNDDTFLESIINEIKQEDINEDISQDKGLVEYDMSPLKEETESLRESVTPELDDKMKNVQSQRSDYSDGYRSSESGYKTSDTNESGYKSMDSFRLSIEKELEESMEGNMSKSTVDSLETWSFVLKICQPILFRHDKNKCYRETRTEPKIWYTENPKLCHCVKDRGVVYEELQMCKMNLVDRVYGCDQIPDAPASKSRNWYPRPHLCLTETHTVPVSSEWEGDDISQNDICRQENDTRKRSNTPLRNEEVLLDREYQRFMKAVWPEVEETRHETPRSTTPVKEEVRKKKKDVESEKEIEAKKSAKKVKQLSSEGWSQESDIEEDIEKSKKMRMEKEKLRKRKRSLSSLSSESEPYAKKTKKILKKKALKKTKSKSAKKRRIGKKILRKLKQKEKKKKKHSKIERIHDSDDDDSDKKSKKSKKKKQQKQKKKNLKRKKKEESTSSSSTSSSESSDEAEKRAKKSKKAEAKKKKEKKRKRKMSTSDSAQSEELFDVNILNNIKTERLTDDEKTKSLMDFSPRRQQKPREIINVKELQNDFVGNNIHIKKEVIENVARESEDQKERRIQSGKIEDVSEKITEVIEDEEKEQNEAKMESQVPEMISPVPSTVPQKSPTISESTIPQKIPTVVQTVSTNIEVIPTISPTITQRVTPSVLQTGQQIKPVMEESNMSLCSSQESVCSVKPYEKDDSHLRPSSQNSNYSFNDVINASQSGLYMKPIESAVECEEKFHETYQQDNYEMYEHLAMAYQSDVASLQASPPSVGGEQRIETVVRARSRGEIKCDWRAGLSPALHPPADRPSRWGLKPGDVNIVLTGGSESAAQVDVLTTQQLQQQEQLQQQQKPQVRITPLPSPQPVYKIQSIANRTDTASGIHNGYDEAYMDMYGASDRLQYGDCFSEGAVQDSAAGQGSACLQPDVRVSTLDARIDLALKSTVLGAVEDSPPDPDKDAPEKGILVMSGAASEVGRGAKRVSFADGYKPGQDSDVEEPPVKKRRKVRRVGCAWPCPTTHPDHVALWDALPPPPPPPGSPPPRAAPPPPLHLLRAPPRPHPAALTLPPRLHKLDANSTIPMFIPSEPPPALVRFP